MTILRWNYRPDYERYLTGYKANTAENTLPRNCDCMPETNIKKLQDHFLIEMAAPGRNKENFEIKLDDNLLTISYQQKEKVEEDPKTTRYIRREFENSDFSRQFSLPETTDKEKIFARYENGVLSVRIPFDDPEKNKISRSININ